MEYKGYTATVEFDNEAGLFHGRVLNLRDVITFQGTSVDELRHEFGESVEDYLDWCVERGEEPDKPCSGKFVVRVEPSLHRDAIVASGLAGLSLNSWVAGALQAAVAASREHSREQKRPDPQAPNAAPVAPQPQRARQNTPQSTTQSTGAPSEVVQITMTRRLQNAAITSPAPSEMHRAVSAPVSRLSKAFSSSSESSRMQQVVMVNGEERDALQ